MEIADEVLVKIEYYDIDEEDPLKQSFKQKSVEIIEGVLSREEQVRYDVQNTHGSIENNGTEHNVHDYEEVDPYEFKWYKGVDDFGKFLCKFCTLSYDNDQTLRYHTLNKHPDEGKVLKDKIMKNKWRTKFQCHICKSCFSELSILKEHVKRVHDFETGTDPQTFCPLCYAKFENFSEMSDHLLAKHKKSYTELYFCNTCGYQTCKVSHFKQHLNTHTEIKTNKCKYCDYATSRLPNLKIHERIHLKCKPYICPIEECTYRAVARSALRSHLLKHKQDPQNYLYCDKCTYKTVYKQSLNKHINSHNRAKIVF